MPAMVKLATETEESTSDVVDYRLVSHPVMLSRNKLWSAINALVSPPRMTRAFEEKVNQRRIHVEFLR